MVADQRPSSNGGASSPASTKRFDRTPPQHLEAEQAVLGAALLSRGALAEVVEIVKPDDFYRTTHEMVFEAILQLFASGETIDPITLVDQLSRNGKLDAVGGASAIHDLVATVPTAANAVYYARIVKEKAILRRLIDAGTQVVSMGYSGTDDVNVAVDRAEQMIYDVAQGRVGSEYSPLKELLSEGFERIEQRFENRSEVTGLATGFNDLDRLTAGLQKQNLIILAARPAMGKCTGSETLITDSKTGRRWRIADLVEDATERVTVDALGDSGRLEPVEPIDRIDNGMQETFTLRTRLGREIRATANHPFLTPAGWKRLDRIDAGEVVAVPRLMDIFGSEELPDAEVALLGYLIGDGSITDGTPALTSADRAIVDDAAEWAGHLGCYTSVTLKSGTDARCYNFSAHPRETSTLHRPDVVREERVNPVTAMLRHHRVYGCNSHEKFVPDAIFTAPREQVALFLSRLFACDGSAWTSSHYYGISYSSVSKRLIQDVQHLLLRFGVIAYVRERQVKYKDTRRTAYELEIRDAANIRRFIEEIGIFSKQEQCQALLAAIDGRNPHSNVDLLPIEVWGTILEEKGERSWADVSEAAGRPRNHNWHVGTRRPSRRIVGELADAMGSQKLRQLAESDIYWDEVVSVEPYGVERVYDLEIPVLHNFVADDILVHNSSLALGISQYVSVNLERPAIIFSLEMSKAEIVDRVLSSEARIDSSKIRTGRLDDADWASLSDAMGRLAEAPLYIDDTASITLMEIRSKCRRLKQREGLDLVIIDYLQLMESHRRTENRQTEVSEISRGCKMLAKELDVPVIALSQLSRQPENRTDKRPQLADLRESGCLTPDTRIVRADTGAVVTLGELHDSGERDIPVWTMDERFQIVPGLMTHVFSSGTKETFELELASGRSIKASANHPFRAFEGWRRLDELDVGTRVAVPRHLADPVSTTELDPDEIVLLAHLIGDGCVAPRQPIHYTSADPRNIEVVEDAARRRFGIDGRRVPQGNWEHLYLPAPFPLARGRRNPIAEWLDSFGLYGARSGDKFIPSAVFEAPIDQAALFLRHLWATDGSLTLRSLKDRIQPAIYYATSSRRLAFDVQLLLLRFGINGRLGVYEQGQHDPSYHVRISGKYEQECFLSAIGCHGERGDVIPEALDVLAGVTSNPNVDTVPAQVRASVREFRSDRGMTERAFQAELETSYCGSALYKSNVSRERLERVATILDAADLADLASSDVLWDRVTGIRPLGPQEVFDATVPGTHNFVADGIVVHNSLEQDADLVSFIYRDEVYDPDSPDRGVAELIVAKHRNGPTGVVKLAFLDHLTKFANLARAGI